MRGAPIDAVITDEAHRHERQTLAAFVGELVIASGQALDVQPPVNRAHARRLVGGRNRGIGATRRRAMRAYKRRHGLS